MAVSVTPPTTFWTTTNVSPHTNLNNSVTEGVDEAHVEVITTTSGWYVAAAVTMVSVVCVVGNSVNVAVFVSGQVEMQARYLYLSLSIADLIAGICFCFVADTYYFGRLRFPIILCQAMAIVMAVALIVSATMLACLSVDRYLSIVLPFRYVYLVTPTRCLVIVFAIWTIHLALFICSHFQAYPIAFNKAKISCQYDFIATFNSNSALVLSHVLLSYVLITIIIFYCQIAVLKAAIHHHRLISNNSNAFLNQSTANNISTHPSIHVTSINYKALLTVALIVGVYYVTWTPFFVLQIVRLAIGDDGTDSAFDRKTKDIILFWEWTSDIFIICNSAANCFIYSFTHTEYRKEWLRIMSKLKEFVKRRLLFAGSTRTSGPRGSDAGVNRCGNGTRDVTVALRMSELESLTQGTA